VGRRTERGNRRQLGAKRDTPSKPDQVIPKTRHPLSFLSLLLITHHLLLDHTTYSSSEMATIHSLPTELVHHILSLAYPPNQPGSCKGLCATALVHSSWRKPSVSVMTDRVRFGPQFGQSTRLFIENGPARVVCS
jgi:hypothetical protein